ncbi:MAG: hypothetical protein AB9842_03380 [Bacteroidales bacterium]
MLYNKRIIPGIGGVMAFFLLFLTACLKEDFDFNKLSDPDLEMEGAVPLIHSNLQLDRILPENSLLVQDPVTGLITLVYETEIFSLIAEDYLKIPDQEQTYTKDNLDILVAPGVDISMNFQEEFSFEPPVSGQRIDSVFIKSGLITLDYFSGINHNCSITLSLPSVTKNGTPFIAEFQHSYTGNLPVSGALQLDLTGYKFLMNTGTGGSQEFPIHIDITVFGDNNPNLSPYSISFNTRISDLRFSKIFGYLGQFDYSLSDSLELAVFSNNFSGSIQFEDLKLSLTTTNSIGMPMQLNINEIKAFSSKNPPYVVDLIDNPAFPNPISFNSPDISNVGQTVQSTTLFTTSNCNLNQALNISPRYICFDFTGKSNPANNPADENFVLDSSRFKVLARVELPFYGSIKDFALTDTLDFTFNDIDRIEEFAFLMVTKNRFPLNVELQVRLLDEQYNPLDSLIYDNNFTVLQAAPIGGPPLYRVIDNPAVPAYSYHPQPLTRERLNKLKDCKKMIIFGRLNTTNSQLVKIYNDYNLDVRMGAKVRFTY